MPPQERDQDIPVNITDEVLMNARRALGRASQRRMADQPWSISSIAETAPLLSIDPIRFENGRDIYEQISAEELEEDDLTDSARELLRYFLDVSEGNSGTRPSTLTPPRVGTSGSVVFESFSDAMRRSNRGFNLSDVNPETMNKEDLKVRHLSREERSMLHKPKSDWQESGRGDVCKSACTLELDDILPPETKKTTAKGGKFTLVPF